ncbi:uncharacterized protein LOC127104675 [Lathyrus oleraceus]|uniref:uncharacterized protein LOC127104675 n=1 Tax=Pisum sativum TaxID=3888 RepID=UPI0021D0CDCC|nr:uncharacterized protein LOC127104675 [Pisum sativum]
MVKPTSLIVKAFDGSRRAVIGEVELPILIGPHVFNITFQVMDINPNYSCLLGRPWIHAVGAVTSTLHQKMKFVVDDKLVIIHGEEDLMVSNLSSFRYIEADEDALETSFQALEIANAVLVEVEETVEGQSNPSFASLKSTRSTIDRGIPEGWGEIINVKTKTDRHGLGYRPTHDKASTNVEGRPKFFQEVFVSRGSQVNAISDYDEDEDLSNLVFKSDAALSNWGAIEIPIIFPVSNDITTLVESNDSIVSPDWDSPIFQAEDGGEEDFEVPAELTRLVEYEYTKLQPHREQVDLINLGTDEDKKEVKIGAIPGVEVKQRLVKLLKDYVDVFAWSYQDMPGLDTDIVVHKLPLKPKCPPVKQKLRRTRPDMALKIRDEVKKQLDAGFLAVAKYPDWVANIVPVPKKDGKVRICVDYRDLNKASPKDDFPLPHIDTLVDNTASFAVFSFMDGFSGYNQIKMDPADREKTTFITPWGTFCYKVMPFEIEAYVDDMIAKSHNEEEHLVHLLKLFERLRKYQLKLNPAKCIFGVRSGKLLGFIVSQRGIEVDPDKVRAIRDMPAPQTETQVRGFLGRLNYISWFISNLTATCEPIFKLLCKGQTIDWNPDCQRAFEKIKDYLQKPPILISPVPGRPLFMYLTVLEKSMGCVLGQHDETGRKEHAIYYLSKKFTDCENRYPLLEKTCCALAWAARRLRQYMMCHTTLLISKMDPIKYIFEKPAQTGRLAHWHMLLSEYDIQYVPQKAIKGSILSDYLADQPVEDYEPLKFDFPDEDIMWVKDFEKPEPEGGPEPGLWWKMMFDGSSNYSGHGIGAVLMNPKGGYTPFTARLDFECTNNIAEYEACILGLEAAIDLRIKLLEVSGDSALVIYQVKGEWETKNEKLVPYKAYIVELIKYFDEIKFEHVPRSENHIADALAMLASM